MPSLTLFVDTVGKRFVRAFDLNIDQSLPPLTQGNTYNIDVRFLKPTNLTSPPFMDDDHSADTIEIGLGILNTPPSAGTFVLADGSDSTVFSGAINYNATAAQLSTALNAVPAISSAGGVTITSPSTAGAGGPWYVTWNTVGVRSLLLANTNLLAPVSGAKIDRSTVGSSTVQEVQTIALLQSPSAFQDTFTNFPGASGTVTNIAVGSGSVNAVQRIVLNPQPYGGSFAINCLGQTTNPIPFGADGPTVQAALIALSSVGSGNALVTLSGTFQWDITFTGTLGLQGISLMSLNTTGLQVAVGKSGVLDLSVAGIDSLVENRVSELTFQIDITPAGGAPYTVVASDAILAPSLLSGPTSTPTPVPQFSTTTQMNAAIAAAIAGADENSFQSITVEAFTGTTTLSRLAPMAIYEVIVPAGTGTYTANVALSTSGAVAGDIQRIKVILAASTNPTFKLYDTSSSGTLLFTQAGTGSIPPFDVDVFFNGTAWEVLNSVLPLVPRMGQDATDALLNAITGAFIGQEGVTQDIGLEKFWNGSCWVYVASTPSTSRFSPLFYTTKKVNGNSRLTVLTVGDSLLDNKYLQLLTALQTQFGSAGFGIGQCAAVSSGSSSVNTGGFNYWPNGQYCTHTGSGTVTYDNNTTTPILGNTLVFPYIKESGAGTFKLQTQSDGGSWIDLAGYTNVSAANSTTIGAVIVATVTKDYLRVRCVSLTGTVHTPATPAIYDSTSTGCLLNGVTHPGINLTQMVTTPAAILNPILSALPADLTFYCNTDDPATQTTYLGTLYSLLNTAYGATTDWVFIGVSPQQDLTVLDPQALGQNSVISSFALAHGQSYFDDYSHYISWAIANAATLMTDGTHPNQQGRELSVALMFEQMGFNSFLNKQRGAINIAAAQPRILPVGSGTITGQLEWVNSSTNSSSCDTNLQLTMRKEGQFTFALNDLKTSSYIMGFNVAHFTDAIANLLLLFGTGGTHLITVDPATGNVVVTGTMIAAGLGSTPLNASNLSSGTVPTARLGSGTASSTTILYGDQTYKTAPTGTVTSVALSAPSSILTVSGSPITGSGTLALTLANALNAASGLVQLDTNGMFPALTTPGIAGTGTISISGHTLTGSGTAFTTQCKVGSLIVSSGGSFIGAIKSISGNTAATLFGSGSISGQTYTIYPPPATFFTANNGGNAYLVDGNAQVIVAGDLNYNFLWMYQTGWGNSWVVNISNSGQWGIGIPGTSQPFLINANAINNGATLTSTGLTLLGTLTQSVVSALLKANSSGTLVAATAGTDYLAPHAAGTPGITLGAGGSGTGSASSISGSDVSGVISVTAGVGVSANATVATITFNTAYGSAPKAVILTPANSAAALLTGATMVYVDPTAITTGVFTITSGTTSLVAATVYKWQYVVPQQ